jgi:hypothetical protein
MIKDLVSSANEGKINVYRMSRKNRRAFEMLSDISYIEPFFIGDINSLLRVGEKARDLIGRIIKNG